MNNFEFDPNKKFNYISNNKNGIERIANLEEQKVKEIVTILPAITEVSNNFPNLVIPKIPVQTIQNIDIASDQKQRDQREPIVGNTRIAPWKAIKEKVVSANIPDYTFLKPSEQTIPSIGFESSISTNPDSFQNRIPDSQVEAQVKPEKKQEKAKSILERLKRGIDRGTEWLKNSERKLNRYMSNSVDDYHQVGQLDIGQVEPVPQRLSTPELPIDLGPVKRVPQLEQTKRKSSFFGDIRARLERVVNSKPLHPYGLRNEMKLEHNPFLYSKFKLFMVIEEAWRIATRLKEQDNTQLRAKVIKEKAEEDKLKKEAKEKADAIAEDQANLASSQTVEATVVPVVETVTPPITPPTQSNEPPIASVVIPSIEVQAQTIPPIQGPKEAGPEALKTPENSPTSPDNDLEPPLVETTRMTINLEGQIPVPRPDTRPKAERPPITIAKAIDVPSVDVTNVREPTTSPTPPTQPPKAKNSQKKGKGKKRDRR